MYYVGTKLDYLTKGKTLPTGHWLLISENYIPKRNSIFNTRFKTLYFSIHLAKTPYSKTLFKLVEF